MPRVSPDSEAETEVAAEAISCCIQYVWSNYLLPLSTRHYLYSFPQISSRPPGHRLAAIEYNLRESTEWFFEPTVSLKNVLGK